MNEKRVGKRTVALAHPPSVVSFANIGGRFEGEGPLAAWFDETSQDSFCRSGSSNEPWTRRAGSPRTWTMCWPEIC